MSDLTLEKAVRSERECQLVNALSDLINAIANAKEAGCIDHIDCWNEAEQLWFVPLDIAARLVSEYEA